MSGSITYSISSTGGVVTGHEPESVITAFCSLFGIKQEKAESYVSAQKLIKKDLTEAQAFAYRDKLTQIGLSVSLEKHGEVDEFGGMSLMPTGDEPAEQTAPVAPSVSSAATAAVAGSALGVAAPAKSTSGYSCPKCQLPQDKAEQCSGCGIYVDKYLAAQTARKAKIDAGEDADAAALDSVSKRLEADNLAWEGEYSFGYLPYAIGAAVVLGLIWYFLGKGIGEIRALAWAFGGFIGVAAAHMGSRGHVNGLICAGLLLLSLSIGKFMLAGHYMDEFVNEDSETSIMTEIESAFAEMIAMADAYAEVNTSSDIEIKRFMIDHDFYPAGTSITDISEQEVADFRYEEGPALEYHYENRDEYLNNAGEVDEVFSQAMGSITRMGMFIGLWMGLFPLLFVALGLGSAYKFGSGFKSK